MKLKMKPLFSALGLVAGLSVFSAQAYEIVDQETFFKDPKRVAQFEKMSQAGNFTVGKQRMVALCKKEANPEVDCGCMKTEIDKLSDKDFFYRTIVAYEIFVAKVKAKKAGDQVELIALDYKQKEFGGLGQDIAKKCTVNKGKAKSKIRVGEEFIGREPADNESALKESSEKESGKG